MAAKKNRRQRPQGKWYGFMGLGLTLLVASYGGYALMSDDDGGGGAQVTNTAPAGGGEGDGDPSNNYRELRTERDIEEADEADQTGDSYVPSMLDDADEGISKFEDSDGQGDDDGDGDGNGDGEDQGLSNEELIARAGGNNTQYEGGNEDQGDGDDDGDGDGEDQGMEDDILGGPQGERAQAIADTMKSQFAQADQYANNHGTMNTTYYSDVYASNEQGDGDNNGDGSGGDDEPLFPDQGNGGSGQNEQQTSQNAGRQRPPEITRGAISPGEMLYAVNDLKLNSDSPTPVRGTVLSGPYKDARLLGEFELSGEYLVVTFNRMQHKGQMYSMNGVAVNPAVPQAMVRSSVDHHGFAKWATFLSANFIGGLGGAVEESGSSISTTSGDGSTTFRQAASYTAAQKAWIAAGKTATKAAEQLEPNIDQPPTVTLEAGQTIGVLILQSQPPENGGN